MATQNNDAWQRIVNALGNPSYDFRTIDGLSEETGLPGQTIESLIESHKRAIRKANVLDREGRALYTLSSRSMGLREILATIRAFAAKTGR